MADRRYEEGQFSYGAIALAVLAAIWVIGIMSQLIAKHVTHEPPPPVKAAAPAKSETKAAAKPAEAAPAAKPADTKTAEVAPAPAVPAAPAPVSGAMSKLKLPDGAQIEASGTGIEGKLLGFVTDASAVVDKKTWFDFDRLNFETGSAKLTADSKAQVDNIAAILKAYPAVKIKIGGYTDNVGDPENNLKLSAARAQTVADTLVALGIAADRLEHEGYGEQFPIADNGTREGRAKNRRIAVSVRAK